MPQHPTQIFASLLSVTLLGDVLFKMCLEPQVAAGVLRPTCSATPVHIRELS